MEKSKPKLGFAMCGSFCTHGAALDVLKSLTPDYKITPILSRTAYETDTRFGTSALLTEKLTSICGRPPVTTITEAERFAASPLDYLFVCPCTGNTLAKIAHGITDTPVTMAVKAHLRIDRPVLIALATNDAMSANLGNIGLLMNRKNIFFVPMIQDAPQAKPHSLVANFTYSRDSIDAMRQNQQLRPIFLT